MLEAWRELHNGTRPASGTEFEYFRQGYLAAELDAQEAAARRKELG